MLSHTVLHIRQRYRHLALLLSMVSLVISALAVPAPISQAASAVTLVKDITTTTDSAWPSSITNVNGTLFFFANDSIHPYALWKKTTTGAVMVKEFMPHISGTLALSYLTNVHGRLFFVKTLSSDTTAIAELWTSDGTESGTVLLKSLSAPNSSGAYISSLKAVGDTLFFYANDTTHGGELWKSDGSIAGTTLVKDIVPGSTGSYPGNFTESNGSLFFIANDSLNGFALWKSDGSESGTILIKALQKNISSFFLTNVNGILFFVVNDPAAGEELWKSDGSTAGTLLVKDIAPGSASSSPTELTDMNGTLYFMALNGLWKSDGSESGTVLIKSLPPATANLTNINGTLFFSVLEMVGWANMFILWKSDGTADGTVPITVLADTNGNFSPSSFTAVNGRLFFTRSFNNQEKQLWTSDGTEAGTTYLMHINPFTPSPLGSAFRSYMTAVGNTLFFVANDITHGFELWQSDGTLSGTSLVSDINQRNSSSQPYSVVNANGKLFYLNMNQVSYDLWSSDGSEAGTVLVKSLPVLASGSGMRITALQAVGDTLFFIIDGVDLWKSDGTITGTVLVKSSVTRQNFSPYLTNGNGNLYFVGSDDGIWTSDGTELGTGPIHQPWRFSLTEQLISANGTLFFIASSMAHGKEVWRSDGTDAGTILLKDIFPGNTSSYPASLTNVNGSVFFTAMDAHARIGLWKSDGTEVGTILVKEVSSGNIPAPPSNLTNVNGTLFFITAASSGDHYELWKSDGTPAGTVYVQRIDSNPLSTLFHLTAVQNTLFFTASDPAHGIELWKSDGTPAGTHIVKDIYPGALGSMPTNLVNVHGTLFFAATDAEHANELWQSDGTESGTSLVQDINPGQASASVGGLVNVNGTLFLFADDGVHGTELWKTTTPFSSLLIGSEGGRIIPGSDTPSSAHGTDFGSKTLGQSASYTFTLTNTSAAPLTLTGLPLVAISGLGAEDFSVTQLPRATLAPGASTQMTITFTPKALGLRSARISIAFNAENASTFSFAVQGQGSSYLAYLPLVLAQP